MTSRGAPSAGGRVPCGARKALRILPHFPPRGGVQGEMTSIEQLFQMGQQMQARMAQIDTELSQMSVSSSSGGGMVTATVDGRARIKSIKIDPAAVSADDVEMLEDLVLAAVSEAQNRAQQMARDEMAKLTGGMNLPFPLPGL